MDLSRQVYLIIIKEIMVTNSETTPIFSLMSEQKNPANRARIINRVCLCSIKQIIKRTLAKRQLMAPS